MGSSSATTGYKYYLDLHLVAGLGNGGSAPGAAVPDGLLQFLAGDRVAWDGLEAGICKANGVIQVNAPDLFGGDEKEGGIVGSLEVQFGGQTQGVNGYLLSKFGTPQSGNRGVFSVVWHGGQVCSNNPYIKPWAFLRRRITGDWSGGCWYEAKAPIPLEGGVPITSGSHMLITGISKGPGTPCFAVALKTHPPTFEGIPQSSGADIQNGTPARYLGMWGVVGVNEFRYSRDNRATWQSGSISNPYATPQLVGGDTGWMAGTIGYVGTPSPAWLSVGTYPLEPIETPAPFTNNALVGKFFDGSDAYGALASSTMEWFIDGEYFRNYQRELFRSSRIDGTYTTVWGTQQMLSAGQDPSAAVIVGWPDLCKINGEWYAIITWHFDGGANRRVQVVRSRNGISDWTDLDIFLSVPNDDHQPFQLCVGGGHIVALCDGGVWTSANGWATWIDNGLETMPSTSRKIAHDGTYFYVIGSTDKCVVSDDGGLTWSAQIELPITGTVGIVDGPETPPAGKAARYCMNAAHIVYQCITEPGPALGYDRAVIDDANFKAVADALYAEGLGLNLAWTKQEKIETFIKLVCDHAGMILLQDRRTGLWKLRLLRQDYNVEDLRVFTPSNCRIINKQRPSPADLVNALDVTYTDYKTGKEATVPVREPAAVQALGRVVKKPHSLTGLPTESLALRCGERDLAAMCKPLWRFDLQFLRDADTLEIGEPFVLDWPASPEIPEGLFIILRVADEIDYGSQTDGRISAKCVEDVFDLPNADAVYGGPMGPYPGGPSDPLRAESMLIEAPYRDLSQKMRADDLAELPSDAGYIGSVAVAANSGQMSYELHARITPADFTKVAVGDYAGSGLLTAGVLPLDAAIHLASEVDTGRLDVGSAAFLGNGADAEMVRINVVYPGVVGAQRGCGDTVPREWPAGTRLWGYDDYTGDDPNQYVDGETVEGKVLSRTATGVAADAPVMSVTLNSRAARPYPPGNVKVNGVLVFAGDPTAPTPPPAPPSGGGGSGISPLGVPASTSPGPNGGFPDTGVPPTPLPSATGADEIGTDGDFSNPGALGAWKDQAGAPLGPQWTIDAGKAKFTGINQGTAFYFPAQQRMPHLPMPRYTVTVTGYIQTDTGVEAGIGIGVAYSTAGGLPGSGFVSPMMEYPTRTLVTYTYEIKLTQPGVTAQGEFVVATFEPMMKANNPSITPASALFETIGMTVDPVPVPTTPIFPAHLDFDAGLTGWAAWPTDPAGDAFVASATGGALSHSSNFSYATERIYYLEAPLTEADATDKYLHMTSEAWSNDPTIYSGLTVGGVQLGYVILNALGELQGRFFLGAQERGDWTPRESWTRLVIPNGAGGNTIHLAVKMKTAPGKLAKVRNLAASITDNVIT